MNIMKYKRSSGILLPVSSLHSPFGIGNIGNSSKEFIDFLSSAKQTFWQICPLGHTDQLNSPYICYSAFAGNPYLIDLNGLVELKLIRANDLFKIQESHFINYKKAFILANIRCLKIFIAYWKIIISRDSFFF